MSPTLRGLQGSESRSKLLTAEEFWDRCGSQRCELIEGVIVEMPPTGGEHGWIQSNAVSLVHVHVKKNRLGAVCTGETGFLVRRDPDTVRAPDLGFVATARIPPTGVPEKFWPIAPDLAVEIVSPSDTYTEVEAKVREWLDAGVREVWVMVPRPREVRIHRPGQAIRLLGKDDLLQSPDLFPGFSVKVEEVFTL